MDEDGEGGTREGGGLAGGGGGGGKGGGGDVAVCPVSARIIILGEKREKLFALRIKGGGGVSLLV